MPGPDAVLFDLDDTLVDWWTSVERTATATAGPDVAARLLGWATAHTWHRRDGAVVARNTWQLAELAEQTWPAALPDLPAEQLAAAVARFREELWVGFFPDTVPALDRLADRWPLGLLSNNPHLHREVERLRLRDWFDVAVDLPRELTKPHPEAFARGCAALGTAPERTAYVGDSIEMDVEGALGAGLVPIWLDRHAEPWTPPAGVLRIESLTELPALLDAR